MDALLSMIQAAKDEARPRFACDDGQHFWKSEGGRGCPTGCQMCSQTVYRCSICGAYDYGSGEESPSKRECMAVCGDSMTGWEGGHMDPDSGEEFHP